MKHTWKIRTDTYQDKLEFLSNKSRFVCMHRILVHAQHSCAFTTPLCMQNTLVHALEGPGPKAGTQKETLAQAGPPALFFGPSLRPRPLQCIHKSVLHVKEVFFMKQNLVPAQES